MIEAPNVMATDEIVHKRALKRFGADTEKGLATLKRMKKDTPYSVVKGDYATYAGNYGATVVAVNSAALLGYDVVKIPGGSHGVMTFAHIEKTSLIYILLSLLPII